MLPPPVREDSAPFGDHSTWFRVTGRWEHPAVSRHGDATTLLLTVATGGDPGAPRLPIDLALVLDRSGSMAGDKLALVKQATIEAAGGNMKDITKLTIYVTNIANRERVWKARAEFFEGDFPACSLVQVAALASPEILVEIEGIAHVGQGG